jgi:hypothetical protein
MAFDHEKELILFSDESIGKGRYYSNFYGGVLVGASAYEEITRSLIEVRNETELQGELKWSKCTESRLKGYCSVIDHFFDFVVADRLRVRIMFRQNAQVRENLSEDQIDKQYFLLYYQFIKHAFGLDWLGLADRSIRLRLYFDQFPDTREVAKEFRVYLKRLETGYFAKSAITVHEEDIAEVRSHEHILLQCLDIVLGSMAFRLNDMHKEKPEGQRRRGKRTIAKEKLYKFIRSRIIEIKPNFNIGESTRGTERYPNERDLPYAHWRFIPKNSHYYPEMTKRGQKINPIEPT